MEICKAVNPEDCILKSDRFRKLDPQALCIANPQESEQGLVPFIRISPKPCGAVAVRVGPTGEIEDADLDAILAASKPLIDDTLDLNKGDDYTVE